jgi:hypothetical protein
MSTAVIRSPGRKDPQDQAVDADHVRAEIDHAVGDNNICPCILRGQILDRSRRASNSEFEIWLPLVDALRTFLLARAPQTLDILARTPPSEATPA